MTTEFDVIGSMSSLNDRDLLSHNAAHAVWTIEPGEVDLAATLLLWSSFDVETAVEPPTFNAAFASRTANIFDGLRWLTDLPDRSERQSTWRVAMNRVRKLTPSEISMTRLMIRGFLETDTP